MRFFPDSSDISVNELILEESDRYFTRALEKIKEQFGSK